MATANNKWEEKLQDPSTTPMCLPLEFLKVITCDFSTEQELGRGGHGVVYKV
jgi:coatomer subunit beta'